MTRAVCGFGCTRSKPKSLPKRSPFFVGLFQETRERLVWEIRGASQVHTNSEPTVLIWYSYIIALWYRMQEGMDLPDGLVVLHERDDHYSYEQVTPDTLNSRMTDFLTQLPSQTRDQFVDQ